jgi:hypothetical protein
LITKTATALLCIYSLIFLSAVEAKTPTKTGVIALAPLVNMEDQNEEMLRSRQTTDLLSEFTSESKTVAKASVTPKNSVLERSSLTKTDKAKATIEFWDKLAVCETNSNWQDTGQYAGGLGIYTKGEFRDSVMGTWEHFGGEEFAPSPDKATKEQQIIIANRISVEGYRTTVTRDADKAKRMGVPQVYEWYQEPVGFNGWGCYKSKSTGKYRMAKPRLYYHDKPHLVPLVQFNLDERGVIVEDLQTYLGVTVDGHYGVKTQEAHVKWLNNNVFPSKGTSKIVFKYGDISWLPELATQAGWKPEHFEKLGQIVLRESGGCPNRIGSSIVDANCNITGFTKATNKSDSGLMQINGVNWDPKRSKNAIACVEMKICTQAPLLDAVTNLKVGKLLFDRSNGWGPWDICRWNPTAKSCKKKN